MSKKTKRIKAQPFTTRAQFDEGIKQIAVAQTTLRKLEANRDARIQDIQSAFTDVATSIEHGIKGAAALCEAYADQHRDELLPNKAKSAETAFAIWGFRTATPSLKPLSKLSWEKIIERIKGLGLLQYIRNAPEVDKQKLLADRATAPLSEIGVRVAQEETFFIEPKVDGGSKIKSEAA